VPEGPDERAGEHGELPVYLLRLSIDAELGVPDDLGRGTQMALMPRTGSTI
jgi:hypothetical protein